MVCGSALHHFVARVLFEPSDKKDTFFVERMIPLKIGVATVEDGDISLLQGDGRSDFLLMNLAGGNHHESGQVS